MKVTIGDATARCPRCGCTDFKRAFRQNNVDVLSCAECGSEHLRGFLIDQITNDTIVRIEGTLRVARQQKQERMLRRLNAAIADAGGVEKLADRLDVQPNDVAAWLDGVDLPPDKVAEELTRLTPGIT